MQRVNYQIALYPPHENREIEGVRKTSADQWISEKSERTKDGTNKMRDMSKRPN